MSESQIRQEEGQQKELPGEEKENIPQNQEVISDTSHESLWGIILLAGMFLFVVISVGGVGWVTYARWHEEREVQNQPSIAGWSEQFGEEVVDVSAEPAQAENSMKAVETATDDSMAAAKKLEISVLNGGAAKGSAGILADVLKKEGYGRTDSGNTARDYIGVTLYYTIGLEKEAAIVKESVAKKYPLAKILPVDTKNKETSVSQVTIILGK